MVPHKLLREAVTKEVQSMKENKSMRKKHLRLVMTLMLKNSWIPTKMVIRYKQQIRRLAQINSTYGMSPFIEMITRYLIYQKEHSKFRGSRS